MSSSFGGTRSGGGGEGEWPRWQLIAAAVGLGIVVTGAVGSIWWLSSRDNKKKNSKNQSTNNDEPTPSISNDTTPNNTQSSNVELTPLEKAREVKNRGNTLFRQKEYQEALQCYKDALEICPVEEVEDIAAFQHNIAAVYENMVGTCNDESEKAILWEGVKGHCTEALKLKPRYIKALFRRVHAHEALGNKRDAILDITRLIILDEEHIKNFAELTQRLLKDVSKELAEEKFPTLGPLEPPTQLVRGYLNTYTWKDDLSNVRLKNIWRAAVGEDEEESSFDDEIFVKVASQFTSGHYSGLIQLLTQAIDEGHAVFKTHALLLRGSLYGLWRRETDAMSDLQAVIATGGLEPEMYSDAHVKMAALYAGLSQMKECYEQFDKALEAKAGHVDVYMQRARIAMESDDPNVILKAREDLEVVLKLAPTAPYTLYCMGSVFHRSGLLSRSMHFFEEARSKFQEAFKSFPECVEGIILYSLFLQDIEEVKLSEELLQKAVKIEPDNASAHFSLSILYLIARRDIDRAMSSLRTAIAMDTSCIQAYETLASLEMQQGNKDKAMELYDSAVNNSRSIIEMQQAFLAREVFTTQNQVCDEYGIDPVQLMTSRLMNQSPAAAGPM